MVWSQYVQDANNTHNNEYSSDDEDNNVRDYPLEYQEWVTWYSDDLMNLWMSMRAYREDTGNVTNFLNHMQWTDFCEFCYQFSSAYRN